MGVCPKILLSLDFVDYLAVASPRLIIATRTELLQTPSWCCFIIGEVNHWTELQNYQGMYSLLQMKDSKIFSMYNLLMFLDLSLL